MQVAASLLLLVVVAASALAQENESPDAMTFGHLRGRFVYDGTPPKPKLVTITTDKPVFGDKEIVEERLLVNPKNGGLANVIIALYIPPGDDPPKLNVHKSYAKSAEKPAVLEYRDGRTVPHVLCMQAGQTLKMINSDPVASVARAAMGRNRPFSEIMRAGSDRSFSLRKPERLPFRVTCLIHPWMHAYVWVRDNPYYAVTAADGSFEIRNIPAGDRAFQIWHEATTRVHEAVIQGEKRTLERGRLTVTFKPGTNDLGEIRLSPKLFSY